MANALSAFTGESIYLDTMLPYLLLRGVDESVKAFFARILRGELTAYTSVLTFDELSYRLLLALVKDKYPGSPVERLREREAELLTEFAPLITDLLTRLRELNGLTLVEVSVPDLDVMNEAMREYHLRPRDALHYAAMKRIGCMNLASNDSDFDRVPKLDRFTF